MANWWSHSDGKPGLKWSFHARKRHDWMTDSTHAYDTLLQPDQEQVPSRVVGRSLLKLSSPLWSDASVKIAMLGSLMLVLDTCSWTC